MVETVTEVVVDEANVVAETIEVAETVEPTEPAPETGLTDADADLIAKAIPMWHMKGYPEKAAVLEECLRQNRRAPANLVYFGEMQPETAINPTNLKIPPRYGPTATLEAWAEFAKLTTDLEPEIIDKMVRKDIIEVLEIRKIIPTETPPGYAKRKN